MVVINGEEVADAAGRTLADYLTAAGYNPERVAVEVNLQIVPRQEFANHTLMDGDTVEIVHFVGGG